MFHRSPIRAIPAAASVSLTLVVTLAVAQPTRFHNVDLLVTHADLDASPNDYFLFAAQGGHSDAAGPITAKRLVAPNGTVFNASTSSISRSSLAQIATALLGTWTAFETLGGIESSYQFEVVSTALDNLPAVPVITSPPNGATVGESFDVHWTFEDPGPPETIGFQYLRNPLLEIVKTEGIPGTFTALHFETNLLAPGPQEFWEFQVIRTRRLPVPTLVDSTPDLIGDDFQFDVNFQAISKPITLDVIPEPGTLAMATIGLVALGSVRSRDRSKPMRKHGAGFGGLATMDS